MKNKYIPRIFDSQIKFALKSKGGVLITGPKSCGKSTTSKRFAKTVIDLNSPEEKDNYISLAKNAPHEFLNCGTKPILIDEWQIIPFIWNNVKAEIDRTGEFGQYILTGSVTDNSSSNKDRHTGTGRIVEKTMRTMSLFESGESNGRVSLLDLKNGIFKACKTDITINDYAFLLCRGGWPLAINQSKEVALQQAIDFYNGTVSKDVYSIDGIELNIDVMKIRHFMRSYARNISTQCPDTTIINDVICNDRTFNKLINALTRLYVIEELESWNPNLRSKIAIRTKNTRHFVDPSIACAALNIHPQGLFKDTRTFGLLFESLVVRDLRIYADSIAAHIYHYRDKADREADAVIQFDDGNWALVEIKLADNEAIDIAAHKLIQLAKDIKQDFDKPTFLMVVTATKTAYKREDGVYVVPLACLKN